MASDESNVDSLEPLFVQDEISVTNSIIWLPRDDVESHYNASLESSSGVSSGCFTPPPPLGHVGVLRKGSACGSFRQCAARVSRSQSICSRISIGLGNGSVRSASFQSENSRRLDRTASFCEPRKRSVRRKQSEVVVVTRFDESESDLANYELQTVSTFVSDENDDGEDGIVVWRCTAGRGTSRGSSRGFSISTYDHITNSHFEISTLLSCRKFEFTFLPDANLRVRQSALGQHVFLLVLARLRMGLSPIAALFFTLTRRR